MSKQNSHHLTSRYLSVPMLVVGADDLVRRANPAAHRLLGYPEGALQGLTVEQITHASAAAALGLMRAANENATLVSIQSRALRADGRVLDVCMTMDPRPGGVRDGDVFVSLKPLAPWEAQDKNEQRDSARERSATTAVRRAHAAPPKTSKVGLRSRVTALALFVGLMLLGSNAEAQAPRLYAGLRAGFGGKVETEGGASDDLVTTWGVQGGFEYQLMRHLSLGGELRFAKVNTESRDDANIGGDLFIDVVAKPKVFFSLFQDLELYGTLPLGVTFVSLSSDLGDGVSADPGATLGFGGGLTYFASSFFALNAEAIYVGHWYTMSGGPRGDVELDLTVGQFAVFANAMFIL